MEGDALPSGGLAAVQLHDPADTATREQVRALLTNLAADPANGIARILEQPEIRYLGGFPDAAFVVAFRPGYTIAAGLKAALVTDTPSVKGTHGYLPSFAEMHASFFALGEGIAAGRDLGTIDMRQIAPTVAAILGVDLPAARQPKHSLCK